MATIRTQGTILNWNGAPVGEVMNVSGLSSPSNKIAIGSFADTVVKTRPGRRKAGDFTFDVNMNPDDTVQIALDADRLADTEREVELILPEGTLTTITFNARIMNWTFSADDDNIYKAQITLKITSIPERT